MWERVAGIEALTSVRNAPSPQGARTREATKVKLHRVLAHTAISYARQLESSVGDRILNIDSRTSAYFPEGRGVFADARDFETLAHSTLYLIIRRLHLSSSDVVFVLGCGKGRSVCHFARQRVREVIGIELDRELASIAGVNAARLRTRKARVSILQEDAATVDLHLGTVFFMFNPFGARTLRAVLTSIERARASTGRPITVVYVHPVHAEVVAEFTWLAISDEFRRSSGLHVNIYRSVGESCDRLEPVEGPVR
jgi:predicted RNA methylase